MLQCIHMALELHKQFTALGLSETETKVYLASLKLGPTSVQEIAKKARLSRTATYEAVATLQERGLMSVFERGKKKFFTASDPDRAVSYFKEKLRLMEERIQGLDRMVPEIKMMAGGEKPTVRFYEGNEALFALFNDVAKTNPSTIDEISNIDDVYEYLDTKYLLEVRKIIDPTKLRLRILHRGANRNPREGVQFCELLPDLGEFHGDIWIYENRVAFVVFVGKVITVIIESKPLADTARVLFEAAWRICQKPETS